MSPGTIIVDYSWDNRDTLSLMSSTNEEALKAKRSWRERTLEEVETSRTHNYNIKHNPNTGQININPHLFNSVFNTLHHMSGFQQNIVRHAKGKNKQYKQSEDKAISKTRLRYNTNVGITREFKITMVNVLRLS